MSNDSTERATSADTVTVMIGSYNDMDQMIPSGVIPSLLANGGIGLDALDFDMGDVTYHGSYQNNLVTQLASAWGGSGSGTQEMSEYSGLSSGTIELTNTTGATIYVAAQGALFYAADGKAYQTQEAPTNAAWTNGTSQTGYGYYAIAPGATVTVPIEATFQGDDANSDAAGSIVTSSVAGITVAQPASINPGGDYTDPQDNNQFGWLTNDFGNYTFVFTDQGLSPAEGHANVNSATSWTAADVASWDGYVENARSVGILNVAPLESGVAPEEDPTQPFATSAFYAGMRQAIMYGGGVEIELSPWYWLHGGATSEQTIIEELRWAESNGLRASILVNSQEDAGGDPDPNFAADTITVLKQLQAEDALPTQVVLENDNPTVIGYYYDADPSDVNSLNAVALDIANDFSMTPTASEDGLEVRGTSTAQTTLIMTGVKPSEDVASGAFAPYAITEVFSEDPTRTLTLTVTDTTKRLALSDSLDGASTGAGGTLSFTGTAAQATTFLQDLTATAASGTVGVASLTLTLTDYLGETTQGVTAVYLGDVHPTFTAVTETASVAGGTVHTGDTVTFTLATSASVTVDGAPTLVLTNGEIATYTGKNSAGDLVFAYTVQPGDDTASLRVRGLRLDGADITNANGLAIDPDSIDGPEEAMANPLAVDTKTGSITSVTEIPSAAGTLASGNTVTILLTANDPIASVNTSGGVPTLTLSDGGTATYVGLTGSGQLEFSYAMPAGGAWQGLVADQIWSNGAVMTNTLGEKLNAWILPASATTVSYNATGTSLAAVPAGENELQLWVSEDAAAGNAMFSVTVDGKLLSGTYSTDVAHSSGQWQEIDIYGKFGYGSHTVTVTFLNNAWSGSTARLLYVDKIALNGVSTPYPDEVLYVTGATATVAIAAPTDTISSLSETGSAPGLLGTGDEVTFLLGGANAIATVDTTKGTPTLTLNDGGIATYAGLTTSGQMKFIYDVPTGGAWKDLAATSLNTNGATITDALGEAVESPSTLPSAASGVSYDATATGTGLDTLVIALSADEFMGDAQAVITINGQQVIPAVDVSAIHSEGQTQLVTITGNFSSGIGTLGISFTNDLYGGSASLDRNLYVDGVTLNGVSELSPTELLWTSTVSTPIVPVSKDELQLWVNENAVSGNAMFSVSIDGKQLAGTYSTDVASSSGKWQEVDIYGNFGSGAHTVSATFLNNDWVGTSDRVLNVGAIGIDGVVEQVADPWLVATGQSATVTIPSQSKDVLTLNVSEDAWNGDAQCYVTIDGKPFGGITTVTASHAAGATQAITIDASGLSTGTHKVGLAFINDAFGGSPATDRNLYLDSATLNGAEMHVSTAVKTFGTAVFEIGKTATPGVTVLAGSSLLPNLSTRTVLGGITATAANTSTTLGTVHVAQSAVGKAAMLFPQS